ncbi:MAG: hypothetical protein Q7T33_11040 [Dehalococcoidia bacterium]|nr:hypothetical protein [Dehalococcoidia bacterium]
MPLSVLLHFGGAGTYTAAFMVSVAFVLVFVFSFAVGRLPEGVTRWSGAWAAAWLRASLPRLTVAGVFAGGLFLASSLSGGGDGGTAGNAALCNRPLPPVTSQPVTEQRLQAAIADMRRVGEAARRGDSDQARVVFYEGGSHNLTHDIDRPLRTAAAGLARDLCLSMVELERQFTGKLDAGIIAREANASAGVLEKAGGVLALAP